ncbi:hypothetical protein EYF80_044397 [Liparis tanakae]|uniref:Uncharacterized protein n=1 Tax=Liparis tanakae TaxID=230148 RepID=A0A4Z2FWW9_9TELE|nr:hypothetical protein EYF80_044397 [Liparis tanakae]
MTEERRHCLVSLIPKGRSTFGDNLLRFSQQPVVSKKQELDLDRGAITNTQLVEDYYQSRTMCSGVEDLI